MLGSGILVSVDLRWLLTPQVKGQNMTVYRMASRIRHLVTVMNVSQNEQRAVQKIVFDSKWGCSKCSRFGYLRSKKDMVPV